MTEARAGGVAAEHDGHTVSIPTWPDVIVTLARDNGLQCRCGPEYTNRGLVATDCQYHDFYDFVNDLLALPVEQRMEAMGMVEHDLFMSQAPSFRVWIEADA